MYADITSNSLVKSLIQIAIEEDLSQGDITSQLSIPANQTCKAEFLAKQDFVVCGIPVVEMLFRELRYNIDVLALKNDGDTCKKGEVIIKIEGKTRQVLASERNALNFLQHLSGIATYARQLSNLVPKLKIMDTRKTTPGLRVLEKYAVRIGGADNHRMGLGDMILVKNNHIDATGGDIKKVLDAIVSNKPSSIRWEVEVRDISELEVAIQYAPDVIMLDNMSNQDIEICTKIIREGSPNSVIEVSGGITEKRLKSLETLGVDCVSIGALTNKISSVDISLRVFSYSKNGAE